MAYPSVPGIVMNPSVPVCLPIEGGICPGKMIIIQGAFNPGADRLSVNLQTGPSSRHPEPDIVLHFDARLNEKCVVRNSLIGGNWGPEERHGGMPFVNNQPFELIILVETNVYKLAVNGKHFTEYSHRLQKELANFVAVIGNVRLNFLKFQGGPPGAGIPSGAVPGGFHPGGSFQPPAGGGYHVPAGGSFQPPAGGSYNVPAGGSFMPPGPGCPNPPSYQAVAPIYKPPVPFTTQIPGGGLAPGKMIFITGVPHSSASRFNINIQHGCLQENDMGLHFDVRFNYGSSRNVVVRNHRQNKRWGPEETQQTFFPFTPSGQFDIIILVEKQGYKVAVNNQHFIEFTHKVMPLSRMDTMNISGDVSLTMIRFQ